MEHVRTEAHNSRTPSTTYTYVKEKHITRVFNWFQENKKKKLIFNNKLKRNGKRSKINSRTGANGALNKHELQTRDIVV